MNRTERRRIEREEKKDLHTYAVLNKEQNLMQMFQTEMDKTWDIINDSLITAMRGRKISKERINQILGDMYASVNDRTKGRKLFGIAEVENPKTPYLITKDQMDSLVGGIMSANCKGCKLDISKRDCEFRCLFAELEIPKPEGFEKKNGCDYYYD
jgi:hypothetical protein